MDVTIKALIFKSLNTDGIGPNLCKDAVIEDRYISVRDYAIAIKSKWDRYGIAYGQPLINILICNLVVHFMVSINI